MKKILIVDDDKNICDLLKKHLEKEGYTVIISDDGDEALVKIRALKPDMILLDVTISGMDGWQVCREIRKSHSMPVIFITAKSEIFDKLLGFELGADDYIVKPFDAREVVARVKAVAKRSCKEKTKFVSKEISFENIHINLSEYRVRINDELIDMPPRELELLYFMASHANRVYTRDQLLDEIWGFDYYGDSRTVDVHIKRLRKKLEGVSDKWGLTTVWGVGYKFESD